MYSNESNYNAWQLKKWQRSCKHYIMSRSKAVKLNCDSELNEGWMQGEKFALILILCWNKTEIETNSNFSQF